VKQVVIENPVLNSQSEEPRRHFGFTEDRIAYEIVLPVKGPFCAHCSAREFRSRKKSVSMQDKPWYNGLKLKDSGL
jgi:hypothetical protein